MKKTIIFLLASSVFAGSASAAKYYCDPATGTMSNAGTSAASPWGTLAAVFTAGKTFAAGDTILLMSGNHGFPVITQKLSGNAVITRYAGSDPILNRIDFTGASRWVLDSVHVYTSSAPPEPAVLVHPVYPKSNNTLVRVLSGSSYITIRNCFIYSAENSSSWTADVWNQKAWNGMEINCSNITVDKCHLKNVNFGISINAANDTVRHSTVENFCGDGLRPASRTVMEYNVIKDSYEVNGNHCDAIQLYAGNPTTGVTMRGNAIITATANRSLMSYGCQGIGCFDGMYDDFIMENNLVVCHHWHGIALYGARNCRIVNNTVVKNPVGSSTMVPWIKVTAHKDGTPASGNLVRNNLTSSMTNDANIGTVDHNVVSTNYTFLFVNYAGLDFHLKAGSAAVNAGISENTPAIDLEQRARVAPYDAGAYEYLPPTGAQARTGISNSGLFESSQNIRQGNPAVIFQYHLSARSHVKLSVFDLLGSEVATLVDAQKTFGTHSIQWNATAYPGRMYISRLIILPGDESAPVLLSRKFALYR